MTQRRWLQPPHMVGQTLFYRRWTPPQDDDSYDHDHCEFCSAKFGDSTPGALTEGYATEDNARWVCRDCFENPELKARFQLKSGPPGTPVLIPLFELPDGVSWVCSRCGETVE